MSILINDLQQLKYNILFKTILDFKKSMAL